MPVLQLYKRIYIAPFSIHNMTGKKLGPVPIVIIAVIIVIAAVLVYGFVINQPHFGFPTSGQINSDTGKTYSQGNLSQGSSNSSLAGSIKTEGIVYHSSSGLISVSEGEFQNSTAATNVYVTFRDFGFLAGETANITFKSFTYTEINAGFSEMVAGLDGKFLFVITMTGLTSSEQTLVVQSVINSMTGFSL